MSKRKHLIVGSGPAALSALDTIRSLNTDDEIRMVSKENTLPYCPAILPYLIAGRTTEKDIWLRDEDFFARMQVTFERGKEVVQVLPDRKQVVYRDGEVDRYDCLLIAAGAEPLPSPISSADGLLKFHTLDDYRHLNSLLDGGKEVAVLGAGMVAVELAVALAERGSKVKMIGRGRPLRAYFDEKAGGYISDILTGHRVGITTGKNISQIKKVSNGVEVLCADGDVFNTDILVSCLGVAPSLSLVKGTGIKANQGILVDSKMMTSVENVYAAGDVAEALSFFDKRPGISAILPNAIAQGKVAGANMAGKDDDYEGWLPMNVLKFFGHSAFSIGVAMPEDGEAEVLEEKDDSNKTFKRLVFRNGNLVGAMFVNIDVDPGVMKYVIERRLDIGNQKNALLEQPKEASCWLMLRTERNVAV
ncbi:MAG: FAD-dependent oxidoreductase [Chloroflexi bacterium]|nr:FAD-dependent oxidoreductase [Chloroflexota bacterium]